MCFALFCSCLLLRLLCFLQRHGARKILFGFNNNFNFSFFHFFFSPDFVVVPTSKTALETRIEFSSLFFSPLPRSPFNPFDASFALPFRTLFFSSREFCYFCSPRCYCDHFFFFILYDKITLIPLSPLNSIFLSPFHANLSRSHFPSLPASCDAGAAPLRDCMLIGDFGSHLEHCFRSSSPLSSSANFAEEQKVVREVAQISR